MQALDRLLPYYQQEVSYLRQAGHLFAQKYPKIARRLDLGQAETNDPHVDRLIQSFAFLTARLSYNIDDRLKDIAQGLLQIIFPTMMAPIPSMSVAQFDLDPLKAKLTSGFKIPKGTKLWAEAEENLTCHFQTVYDQTLWPINIRQVEYVPVELYPEISSKNFNWLLKIKIQSYGVNLNELDFGSLVFHITGNTKDRFSIYEGIFSHLHGTSSEVWISEGEGRPLSKIDQGLKALGFQDDELAIPYSQVSQKVYGLLREYFPFPEKFLFFEVKPFVKSVTNQVDILMPLAHSNLINEVDINKAHLSLGCVPIVNIFPKVTDPLKVDHQKSWYRLVPDQRRQRTHEIYSIEKIYSINEETGAKEAITPYFSLHHRDLESHQQLFWHAKRISSLEKEGSEIELSFVDFSFNPNLPQEKIIYADALCTNRYLASQIPAGGGLYIDDQIPPCSITCQSRPTQSIYTPLEGDTLWRLISLLGVNHMFFSTHAEPLEAIREVLSVLGGGADFHELEAFKAINFQEKVLRTGKQAWMGFVPGLDINIDIDPDKITDKRYFLLGSILQYFFSYHVSVNNFTRLNFNHFTSKERIASWNPLHGEQRLY